MCSSRVWGLELDSCADLIRPGVSSADNVAGAVDFAGSKISFEPSSFAMMQILSSAMRG